MPKSERLKSLSAFALLFCVVIACNQSPAEPTTLKSPDGKFQITVPGGWKASDNSPKGEEILNAENREGDMALSIGSASKASLGDDVTLDIYTERGRNSLLSDSNVKDVSQPASLQVNGNDARQYDLKRDSSKNSCLVTIVETTDHFNLIYACTPTSKYDANKATLKQVSETFRPV